MLKDTKVQGGLPRAFAVLALLAVSPGRAAAVDDASTHGFFQGPEAVVLAEKNEPGWGSFASASLRGPAPALQSRAGREIERVVSSPLTRLPANARARGWAEVGLHARSGEGPGMLVVSPFGTAYYRLADPVYVTVALGAVGELVFEGDDSFRADAHVGNPYLGFGFDLPIEGLEVQLLGGFTVPLAGIDGGPAYAFARGMRGGWSPWLWSSRRLSLVAGARFDMEGEGPLRFGGEAGVAPMFWFGEGSLPARLALQTALQGSVVLLDVIDAGVKALAVSPGGDAGAQLATEIFVNVQGSGQRIYHARLTVPLNEPYGFAFGPNGFWGLHLAAGMVL